MSHRFAIRTPRRETATLLLGCLLMWALMLLASPNATMAPYYTVVLQMLQSWVYDMGLVGDYLDYGLHGGEWNQLWTYLMKQGTVLLVFGFFITGLLQGLLLWCPERWRRWLWDVLSVFSLLIALMLGAVFIFAGERIGASGWHEWTYCANLVLFCLVNLTGAFLYGHLSRILFRPRRA